MTIISDDIYNKIDKYMQQNVQSIREHKHVTRILVLYDKGTNTYQRINIKANYIKPFWKPNYIQWQITNLKIISPDEYLDYKCKLKRGL